MPHILRRTPMHLVTVAVAIAAASCASGTGPATMGSRSSGSRLDSADFRKPEFRTMYDAIKTLRPDWLQVRGGSYVNGSVSATPTLGVFIEGQAHGFTVDKLQEMTTEDVTSVRRILPSESMATYGTQWAWGGIVLTRAR